MPDFKDKTINEGLALALKTRAEASCYETSLPELTHIRPNQSQVSFKVNNPEVFKHLQSGLSSTNFSNLFKLCEKNGVFDLAFEHHIPRVTLTAGARHMTRKWPRDHAGMLPLIAARYPAEFWAGLHKIAKAYTSKREIGAFKTVMQNPKTFCQNKGVAHVFWLLANGSLRRDSSWDMHQRIESHSEFLRELASALSSDADNNSFENFTKETISTVVYFTHYLHILGINPPTCGPWEEIPFAKGSNWDCASVIMAFQAVQSLLKKLQKHPEQLKAFLKIESKLTKELNLPLLLAEPQKLETYCQKSQSNIRRNYLDEFRGLTKRIDSSSAMLAGADISFSADNNLAEDTKLRFEILERFRTHLVGSFGARRYNTFTIKLSGDQVLSCDSYLNLNSNVFLDTNGEFWAERKKVIAACEQKGGDNSHAKNYCERAKHGLEEYSAQWGLPLSYAALAYAKIVCRLVHKGNLTQEEQQLLHIAHNGECEFIARTYANITGLKADGRIPLKANGEEALIWKKPEAYQAVSTALPDNRPAFLPGVNSHLGWDASICWQASKLFLQNLLALEKSHLL